MTVGHTTAQPLGALEPGGRFDPSLNPRRAPSRRITVDISPFVHRRGGLGRYAGELLAALARTAPENDYLGFYNALREMPIEEPLQGFASARVALGAKPWRLSVLLAYYARFSMDRWLPPCDVFHGTDHLLPPLRSARTVFTIHDLTFRLLPQHHLPLSRWFLRSMVPRFLRSADAIIAGSENTRRDVTQWLGIPAERMTVIHHGVDREFRPIEERAELDRVRARHHLPPRFVLFFGTLEPRKNLVTLLEAYAALLEEDPTLVPLVIAGRKGWLYRESLRRISELGLTHRVQLTDWVPAADVPALFNLAEVLVFPSCYEGFGLPPLEAMACGTPVISSNASSLPEVIGDAGILVEPLDVSGLASALRRVLQDEPLRRELSAKGLKQASRFTWERAARETLAVYESLGS